ncbi:MAG TPA: DCC1-like thiol-disulfide oxidoreductase family protein [Polyangiales bacterium]|nr:DCC1-like thiol-disulfide oxidoreductase family protein [Polyangiales bacterium]
MNTLLILASLALLAVAWRIMRRTKLVEGGKHVLLIDGVCVFCNGFVSLILRLDRARTFHFAHIQGVYGRATLLKHGRDPADLDPIYLVANAGTPDERLLIDGEAAREVYPRLSALGRVARLVPLPLLNIVYVGFARVRYRLVGKYDSCRPPTPEERGRYLE